MKKVYIVQFDWATPDAISVDLYVYDSYDKAYDKFKKAGPKPFILAFLLYVWLLAGGWALSKYVAPMLL